MLPETEYDRLLSGLFLDPEFKALRALSTATSVNANDAGEMAKQTVRLAEAKGKAVMLLSKLVEDEVKATKSTAVLFRANTLACKALDDYMRLVALPWVKCLAPGAKWILEHDDYYCGALSGVSFCS